MKIFSFKVKELSPDNIFDKVSDQQIYEFYLGEFVSFNRKYKSPFRHPDDDDTSPSLTFMVVEDGSVVWRDWGKADQSKAHGIFQFVMELEQCTFQDALKHINTDMKLGLGDKADLIDANPKYEYMEIPAKREAEVRETVNRVIEIQKQAFTKEDIVYWAQYGISTETLLKFGVSSVKYVWLDQTLIRQYSRSSPVYAYDLGMEDSVRRYKIYSPLAISQSKWITNAKQNMIQGLEQLVWDSTEDLIITKSLKDVMVLDKLGYHAIALQSEGSKLAELSAKSFKALFQEVYVFYDNDSTGIEKSSQLCCEHNFKRIQLNPIYQAKDISDYVKLDGLNAARVMMTIAYDNADDGLPF